MTTHRRSTNAHVLSHYEEDGSRSRHAGWNIEAANRGISELVCGLTKGEGRILRNGEEDGISVEDRLAD